MEANNTNTMPEHCERWYRQFGKINIEAGMFWTSTRGYECAASAERDVRNNPTSSFRIIGIVNSLIE